MKQGNQQIRNGLNAYICLLLFIHHIHNSRVLCQNRIRGYSVWFFETRLIGAQIHFAPYINTKTNFYSGIWLEIIGFKGKTNGYFIDLSCSVLTFDSISNEIHKQKLLTWLTAKKKWNIYENKIRLTATTTTTPTKTYSQNPVFRINSKFRWLVYLLNYFVWTISTTKAANNVIKENVYECERRESWEKEIKKEILCLKCKLHVKIEAFSVECKTHTFERTTIRKKKEK